MKDSRSGRLITSAIVFGGIIGTYFLSRPRKNSVQTVLDKKRQKKIDRNLLTPANATFGLVWSSIYIGTIALVIHQTLSSQRYNPRYKKAQLWLRLNYILTGIFGYFFSKSDKKSRIGAALVTISMLPAAIGLHRALEIGETEVEEPENIFRRSVSLYTGWLTAASAVSVTTLIQEAGYFRRPESAKKWALGSLPVVTALSLLVSKKLNDPYYLLTVVAALAGIAVKQKEKNSVISILAATLAASLLGDFAAVLRAGIRNEQMAVIS